MLGSPEQRWCSQALGQSTTACCLRPDCCVTTAQPDTGIARASAAAEVHVAREAHSLFPGLRQVVHGSDHVVSRDLAAR